ncbi:MAG: multiheme C-type cytochrome [Desulfocapsa sp.]|nr:multiheme C-type cytochrome [Desulfocapsa sp.]
MKNFFGLNLLAAVFFLFWACLGPESSGVGNAASTSSHPEISEQEKLLPCFECHEEATPEVYKEWYDSLHGIGMVKCYQCHGTYENMQTEPPASACMACHADMVEKCPKDKKCAFCHNAHTFKRSKK